MNWKVEGNILYPDKSMLTWGPFYYHSKERAKIRMEEILLDITNWCNMKDPSLDICPQNVKRLDDLVVFDIQAWKDETTLQKCDGIIEVEFFKFEDNTLEVKEVDLDYIKKELDELIRFNKPAGDFGWGTLYNVATHFFELGLKAQKGR